MNLFAALNHDIHDPVKQASLLLKSFIHNGLSERRNCWFFTLVEGEQIGGNGHQSRNPDLAIYIKPIASTQNFFASSIQRPHVVVTWSRKSKVDFIDYEIFVVCRFFLRGTGYLASGYMRC